MGFLDLFNRKPTLERAMFSSAIDTLVTQFEALREQFVFGVISGMKSEGVQIPGVSQTLERESDVDSILIALQFVCVVGFAWDYIKFDDRLSFDRELAQRIITGNEIKVEEYRERYLECQGNIECLQQILAEDIYIIWGKPEPARGIRKALSNSVEILGILSQAETARVCGDERTERKLKKLLYL